MAELFAYANNKGRYAHLRKECQSSIKEGDWASGVANCLFFL
ncbi:hypothetical protein IAD21_04271 [Abditibacteriota bacterium]|nr:hypothetical protein IAD21_04271 [Abditibacteriota bacterium]